MAPAILSLATRTTAAADCSALSFSAPPTLAINASSTTLIVVESEPSRSATTNAQAERGRILGEAANLARPLANAPGNLLTPTRLAEEAIRAGATDGFGSASQALRAFSNVPALAADHEWEAGQPRPAR